MKLIICVVWIILMAVTFALFRKSSKVLQDELIAGERYRKCPSLGLYEDYVKVFEKSNRLSLLFALFATPTLLLPPFLVLFSIVKGVLDYFQGN